MRIKKLELSNYRSLRNVVIDFKDITVFVGRNDTGKSNILKAIDLLFNGGESRDLANIRAGGNELRWALELNDNTLFTGFEQRTVRITGEIELDPVDVEHLFPSDTIKMQSSPPISRSELGYEAKITRNVTGGEPEPGLVLEHLKIGKLELHRKDGHSLMRGNEDVHSYTGGGTNLAVVFMHRLQKELLLVPAVRQIQLETRSRNNPRPEGLNVPSTYLRFEKDASLGMQRVYDKVSQDTQSLIPRYGHIAGMETGEDQADVFFDRFPSSTVGDGTKQQFLYVFDLHAFEPGIVGIEEPEIHLHPERQRRIFEFLKEQASSSGKQVLITSHSPVFAARISMQNVRLVSLNEERETVVEEVTEENSHKVIEELGISPGDFLDDDAVLFVEGQDDVRYYNEFRKKLSSESRIGIVDSEGWNSMGYYANARVLKSRAFRVPIFIVFDGHMDRRAERERLIHRLESEIPLPQDHITTLHKNSIEDYLLVTEALWRAFPQLGSRQEIGEFLRRNESRRDKKNVLDTLFKLKDLGRFTRDRGAKIIQSMEIDEIDEEIKDVFQRMLSEVTTVVPSGRGN